MKRASLDRLRLQPNPPAVLLRHLPADRQSDTRSRVLVGSVQPFEQLEDARWWNLEIDADAVVAHGKDPFLPAATGTDTWTRGGLAAVKLHGVAQEILKKLARLRGIDRRTVGSGSWVISACVSAISNSRLVVARMEDVFATDGATNVLAFAFPGANT